MEIAVIRKLCFGLNPNKSLTLKQTTDVFAPHYSRTSCFPCKMANRTVHLHESASAKQFIPVHAVLSDVGNVGVSSSEYGESSVTVTSMNEVNKLKLSAEVSGAKTQEIFDGVFFKMVAAAQPIPGFRRVKGGETPNIPIDILLEVIGPSKVYKEVIKKVIDSTISEYVEKEGLLVGKDLSVEQSFEELEATFEPGDSFRFDAIVQCQELN